MSKLSHDSSIMFIFFKSSQNELYAILPLLSNLELAEIKNFIAPKLSFPKNSPFHLFFEENELLDTKSLSEQGVTNYSELVVNFPIKEGNYDMEPVNVTEKSEENQNLLNMPTFGEFFPFKF